MNAPWVLICLVFSLVLFFMGAVPWPPSNPYRIQFVSAAGFFYILSLLLH